MIPVEERELHFTIDGAFIGKFTVGDYAAARYSWDEILNFMFHTLQRQGSTKVGELYIPANPAPGDKL